MLVKRFHKVFNIVSLQKCRKWSKPPVTFSIFICVLCFFWPENRGARKGCDRCPLFLGKQPTMPCRLYSNKIHTYQYVKHQHTTLVIPVKINVKKMYTLILQFAPHWYFFGFVCIFLFLDIFWRMLDWLYIYYFLKLFTELIWYFSKTMNTPKNQRNKNKKIMHTSVFSWYNRSKLHQI